MFEKILNFIHKAAFTGENLYKVVETDLGTGQERGAALIPADGLADAKRKVVKCYGGEVEENPSHRIEVRSCEFRPKKRSVEFEVWREPDD